MNIAINSNLSIFGINQINNNKLSDISVTQALNNKNNTNVANLDKVLKTYEHYYNELAQEIPIAKDSILDKILNGKMSQEEINSLNDFKKQKKASVHWIDKELQKEYISIYHTSKSIDEFKERYLELQAKHEAKFDEIAKQNKKDIQKEMQEVQKQYNQQKQENDETFKPIKGESQNKETYQNKDTNDLLKKLLENKFNLSKELEILFGVKINDEDINNNDFTKIFSNANLHNIKSVDLKA